MYAEFIDFSSLFLLVIAKRISISVFLLLFFLTFCWTRAKMFGQQEKRLYTTNTCCAHLRTRKKGGLFTGGMTSNSGIMIGHCGVES